MNIDWKELAEKYQLESEIHSMVYDDLLSYLRVISVMEAVIVQMESERLKFETEKGPNEKSKLSGERIQILLDGMIRINGLAEKNIRLREILKSNSTRLMAAEEEIENLKKQLSWE